MTTVAIIAVGLVLLVVVALIGNSEEVTYPDTFDFDPADHDPGTAIVVSKRMNEGLNVLGIAFREPEFHVSVAFTVPGEECFFALAGQETWPVPDVACPSPPRMSGVLSGVGSTDGGDTYVGVTLLVGEECYSHIALGTPWAATGDACL